MKRHARGALFIERSLKGALNFFKEAVFSEEIARSNGLLQLLDPRLKIIILAASLFWICFIRDIRILAALYLLSLLLASASRINIFFFIKRVWFFIPLFTLVIAIPAFFMQGAHSAIVFIIRVATCVSLAVLVTVTTRHGQLLKSLKSLGIPNLFVQIIDMAYRYIFFFVKVFEEMHLSLKARLIRRLKLKRAYAWLGSRIGYVFKRSVKMSEDVYLAMIARGYTGDIKRYGK